MASNPGNIDPTLFLMFPDPLVCSFCHRKDITKLTFFQTTLLFVIGGAVSGFYLPDLLRTGIDRRQDAGNQYQMRWTC
jgi:hypothetical protein